MKFVKSSLLAATAAAGMFGATAVNAQAFYLQEQSTRGAGRAFSGEGADEGAQSLWWNPAAMADIERAELAIGVSGILPSGKVSDAGTLIVRPGQRPAPVGGDLVSKDPINKGVLPSGSVAIPLGKGVAVGLTVASPYSFTTEYSPTSWARYSALKTELRTYDIQPSIAVAPTDWLRLGVALNAEYTKADLGNALPNLLPTLPDGSLRLKGDGWDYGWTAGAQIHQPGVTVGFSYKSSIKHNLTGSMTVAGLVGPLAPRNAVVDNAKATFSTPDQYILAGRFAVSPQVTLNGQAVRYGWEKFDAIRLAAPINSALPEGYRNTWSLAGGIDYHASPDLTIRGGIQRAFTPTVERDARVPDTNRTNYALGASFRAGQRFTIDAAANYVSFADASIDRITAAYAGTAAQTPVITRGTLKDASAVVLSLGGKVTF